jgi:hypothetical protein
VFVDGGVEVSDLGDTWLKGEDEFGVAGDDLGVVVLVNFGPREERGVGFGELVFDARGFGAEALGDVGARERVGWFGETGDAFGGKAEGDDFGSVTLEGEGGLKVDDVMAGTGD